MRCLNDYKNHPIRKFTNLKSMTVSEFASNVQSGASELGSDGDPNSDAFEFYFLNHCFSELKNRFMLHKPLCDFSNVISDFYHEVTVKQACRLVCYISLITTRECRHCKSSISSLASKQGAHDINLEFFNFLKILVGHGESSAIKKFYELKSDMTVIEYFEGIYFAFYNGNWNGGYGGKAWAAVTELLLKYLKGEITSEIFVDQAYTLCHNNGPIFNKGMLYNMYDHKYKSFLDLQAQGNMPNVFKKHKTTSEYKNYRSKFLLEMYDQFVSFFGEEFFEYKQPVVQEKKKPEGMPIGTEEDEYFQIIGPCGVKVKKVKRFSKTVDLPDYSSADADKYFPPPPQHFNVKSKINPFLLGEKNEK